MDSENYELAFPVAAGLTLTFYSLMQVSFVKNFFQFHLLDSLGAPGIGKTEIIKQLSIPSIGFVAGREVPLEIDENFFQFHLLDSLFW